MSFEDEDLDAAYKLLEGTEKFCASSKGFKSQTLTPHEKLYRRSIIADCLLFEAILVFLKQGFTSYVKGGYILRKAWKQYDRLYTEVNQLCSTPSPITLTSKVDKHVGTSLYDDEKDGSNEGDILEEPVDDGVDPLTSSLPGLLTGLEEAVGEIEKDLEGDEEEKSEATCSTDTLPRDSSGIDEADTDDINGGNGYELPEMPNSSIQNLDDDDSRLRGGLYFGFGLMNVIVSLIPPKLIKVANLFGFHGSRKIGLQALEYSSRSQDMKAPLARLFNIVIYLMLYVFNLGWHYCGIILLSGHSLLWMGSKRMQVRY